jgi:phosphotransferase system HPr (HPr) family protein
MSESSDRSDRVRATVTLAGDLHARPAGAMTVAAKRFDSTVTVTVEGSTVDATSPLSMMALGARAGQQVTVTATGPDAEEAVVALVAILSVATKVGT